jgi:glycosyltransferase involved in cell wall biosynthesis
MAGPFIGDDRFRALADLDVLLHPSRYEGLPRVIREAAAVGTPAIVTLQTNAESLVDAGGATLTGPDPGSIAAAVRSAIADAGWRSAASLAAQTWAKENDWVQCARHFQAAYERATTMMRG